MDTMENTEGQSLHFLLCEAGSLLPPVCASQDPAQVVGLAAKTFTH